MNKLKFWILIIVAVGIIYPIVSYAAEYFRPNIEIPGMHNFFGDLAVEDEALSTTSTTVYKYQIDGSGIIRYVQALYGYSVIIVGFIAMFMLVFAAYQRLLAAGNAEKISRSLDTIRGTLLGLTILFSGYLLLSQISERLVLLTPIDIPEIAGVLPKEIFCQNYIAQNFPSSNCRDYFFTTSTFGDIYCISHNCPSDKACINNETGDLCISYGYGGESIDCYCASTNCSDLGISSCEDYDISSMCQNNTCFDKENQWGTVMEDICYYEDGECKDLTSKNCDYNSDCQIDGIPSGSEEWCCKNQPLMPDTCGTISDPYSCL